MKQTNVFQGTIPALMTPCSADGTPSFDARVLTGQLGFRKTQWEQFRAWWSNWPGAEG